jgi:outer membrane protein assembly factor BamB
MRASLLTAVAAWLVSSSLAFAQVSPVRSDPKVPDAAALGRLNLKTEWTISLPLLGRNDAVSLVQLLDGDQFVVQTRSGLVAMMDSRTGSKLWSYQLPASNANVYPIGHNEKFIFVINVTRVYGLERTSGLMDFELELPSQPNHGPTADRDFVYIVSNANRVTAYRLPEAPAGGPKGGPENRNLAMEYLARSGGSTSPSTPPTYDRSSYNPATVIGTYTTPNQKTPSIAALPSVTPPYSLAKRELLQTPSVSVMPSLRQPYHYRPEHLQYNQITPSIAVIPPSIYRVNQLANFRPKPVQPEMVWSHLVPYRIGSQPLRIVAYPPGVNKPAPANWFSDRIWIASDRAQTLAISGYDGLEQVSTQLRDSITTPIAGPLMFDRSGTNKFARPEDLTALGFVGLTDGTFVALDLGAGGREAEQPGFARIEWKINLGSPATNKPLVTNMGVYASGEHAGVTKLNAQTGEELWETESVADRILAVNAEYAYVMDRTGGLRIYDNNLNGGGKGAVPHLAKIELPGFNIPLENQYNDRVFLVADSGMMVCLRDAAPKYNRPFRVAPAPPEQFAPKPPAAPMEMK